MIPFLVAMMLLTGVCNTLLSKYQVSDSMVHLIQCHADLPSSYRTSNALPIATPQTPTKSAASLSP